MPKELDRKVDINEEVRKYETNIYTKQEGSKYGEQYYDKYLVAIKELERTGELRYETWESNPYNKLDKQKMRSFMKHYKLMNPRIMSEKIEKKPHICLIE